MACTASRAVAIAKAENGTKETGNNINKYAAYIDKNCPNFYNGKKQGVPYCDVFFDYCIIKDCDGDYKKAEKVLCQPPKSAGAGCVYSYGYYKAAGRTGKTPKLGAQVFFGSSEKTLSHTGMVISISADGKKFTTEEGNSDNMVKQHTYTIGAKGSKVFGFGYPKYDAEPASKPAASSAEQDQLPAPAKPAPAPAKPAGKTYHVKVNTVLNVRTGASTAYKVVAQLKNGTAVTVYEQKNGWGRIGNGRWVSMNYLK